MQNMSPLFERRSFARTPDSARSALWRRDLREITFNGRQYRVEGDKVWTLLAAADVRRRMQWGNRAHHRRALPSSSPLRRYLVKIARGEKAELPRLQ
jgi:hypothetical protein